jgi:uncharacterized membrane protein
MRRFRLLRAIRTGLWFTPLACVFVGFLIAVGTVTLDRHFGPIVSQRWTGTARDVQTLLSTVASSMVTLTGLVLTMTLVVVQLAMGQFSPRVVRPLLENHPSQVVIGVFGATLVQALMTLREVDVAKAQVPGVSVLATYALVVGSLVLLVIYVHKIGIKLRGPALIDTVGDRARDLVDELYPPEEKERKPEPALITAPKQGAIVRVLRDRMIEAAREADCMLELVPMVGDFVPRGVPLVRIHGDGTKVDHAHVARFVIIGDERAYTEDLAAALRSLVDIAERGLQQPFADPTTAVQAIHRLHDLLRQLATRDFPDGRFADDDGRVRFVEPTRSWDAYVRLAFDELRIAGAASPQIPRRLRAALEDLKRVAPSDRQAPLDRQLSLLEAATREALDEPDADAALVADVQGIGSGRDMVSTRTQE